ncbi:Alpha-1-antitrypsin-like protein CM55-MM [Thelohanellus kitauei]|uniref:Alpha-1-antitrypsin-like protein CM55-MM n=1 Tax=Thelohanellus kitauei TaxID=669202 RepID=A0A0C2IIP0_THEKT|nr:Alpha-1-antitrypsin-like protein CM55-MM [Thelohanellus kitauei]
MSAEGVNIFTSIFLNQIFAFQNGTGNIVLSGIGLYALMGAINIGLRGAGYGQVSEFLDENFKDLFDKAIWKNSQTARKWINLLTNVEKPLISTSALFYSCYLYDDYQKMTNVIFKLHQVPVNFSNPTESAGKINKWIYQKTYRAIENVFDESMLSENIVIFIHTLFFRAD